MVYFRIYSVIYYFGLIVLCLFLSSHQISNCRCAFVMHPLPELSVGLHIFRHIRRGPGLLRHFLIIFIIIVFLGLTFHIFSVLDDLQFPVQDVTENFVPSSVFTIKTRQAVSVVRCYMLLANSRGGLEKIFYQRL